MIRDTEVRSRVPESAPGPYFVDHTCIDCDTCRAIAPEHFRRHGEAGYSYIWRQPATEEERARVEEALDCCPTRAIGREGEER
jgi:ferredoxin